MAPPRSSSSGSLRASKSSDRLRQGRIDQQFFAGANASPAMSKAQQPPSPTSPSGAAGDVPLSHKRVSNDPGEAKATREGGRWVPATPYSPSDTQSPTKRGRVGLVGRREESTPTPKRTRDALHDGVADGKTDVDDGNDDLEADTGLNLDNDHTLSADEVSDGSSDYDEPEEPLPASGEGGTAPANMPRSRANPDIVRQGEDNAADLAASEQIVEKEAPMLDWSSKALREYVDTVKRDVIRLPIIDNNVGSTQHRRTTARPRGDQVTTKEVQDILRVFDLTSAYGPCTGMTRLARWKRAEMLELDPPQIVHDILVSQEGLEQKALRENVFEGEI